MWLVVTCDGLASYLAILLLCSRFMLRKPGQAPAVWATTHSGQTQKFSATSGFRGLDFARDSSVMAATFCKETLKNMQW